MKCDDSIRGCTARVESTKGNATSKICSQHKHAFFGTGITEKHNPDAMFVYVSGGIEINRCVV